MIPDTLTEEIMSYVRERTEKSDHLKLTVEQYNAVYEAIHKWIYDGGEKIKEMLRLSRSEVCNTVKTSNQKLSDETGKDF